MTIRSTILLCVFICYWQMGHCQVADSSTPANSEFFMGVGVNTSTIQFGYTSTTERVTTSDRNNILVSALYLRHLRNNTYLELGIQAGQNKMAFEQYYLQQPNLVTSVELKSSYYAGINVGPSFVWKHISFGLGLQYCQYWGGKSNAPEITSEMGISNINGSVMWDPGFGIGSTFHIAFYLKNMSLRLFHQRPWNEQLRFGDTRGTPFYQTGAVLSYSLNGLK